jgi:hypothetical protein
MCQRLGCFVGLCFTSSGRRGCLDQEQFNGFAWSCPKHNDGPSKIKVDFHHKAGYDMIDLLVVWQYDINNIGRAGLLHYGRTLVPLLYLHIYPGEVGFQKPAASDNITIHLQSFYQHAKENLVSHAECSVENSVFTICNKLCSLTAVATHGWSLHAFRIGITKWMEKHRNSAVLVLLDGHTSIQSGEIVYATPFSKIDRYTTITQVCHIFSITQPK